MVDNSQVVEGSSPGSYTILNTNQRLYIGKFIKADNSHFLGYYTIINTNQRLYIGKFIKGENSHFKVLASYMIILQSDVWFRNVMCSSVIMNKIKDLYHTNSSVWTYIHCHRPPHNSIRP